MNIVASFAGVVLAGCFYRVSKVNRKVLGIQIETILKSVG